MPPTAANLAALVVALLAACAALWLDLDAVQPLRRLLDSWQTPASSSVSDEAAAAPPELDFNALRAHSAALSDDALRWGTYRSGLYHGIRSRTFPYSVSAGLLWGSGHEDVSQLRHECRQEDRLQKYGWLHHDGRRYGWQSVEDQFNRVDLHTHYVRLADQRGWASRFSVVALEPNDERLRKKVVATTKLSLFFYVDLGCGDESVADACRRQLQGLMDVASDLSEGPCGDRDDSFACASVAFESEGVDEKYKDDVDGPFAFQLLAQLKTRADASRIRQAELRFAGLKDATVLNVKERLVALATRSSPQEDEEITLDNTIEEDSTLLVMQATIEFDATQGAVERGDIELDIVFQETSESGATLALSPRAARELVDAKLPQYRKDFEDKFEETFHLATSKGYNTSEVAFAQAAFSNLLGGTGFFYGKSLVQRDPFQPEIEETPPAPLFTAVPSRSFFPRGFLWDDGFHQLGISTFDDEISRDVLVHWLGLMDDSGYIAREQILGKTARRRVPNEFIVQHVEHANPPTLLLTLDKIVAQWEAAGGFTHEAKSYVKLVFPFLDRWYTWFAATQRGPLFQDDIATTQWRGRHTDDGKLIANTLSSGLDDYPRASTPSGMEMHLDLLCWMIKASDLLASLGSKIGLDANRIAALQHDKQRYLAALDAVHWSDESQSYFDVGEHSAGGHIAQHVVVRCRNEETGQTRDTTATYEQLEHQQVRCPPSHPRFLFPLGDGQGGLKMQPVFVAESPAELQHVKHIGYVSLFPLLLEIVTPESPKLGALLEQLASPDHLWSPFGLRSLSIQDLFYEQANAHGDNPYWRGSIWINLNYLALKALHHYGELDGPFQQRARELYAALRGNVVSTIHGEYERTGYLWEQYSGNIHAGAQYGRGQRCHPFSGWTALVVNIMAEKY